MIGATFPELDSPARRTQAHDAEIKLLAFVLRDLSKLDHLPGLTPQLFGDDQYRAVFAHQQRARAAGRDGMDLLAVAAALPGVVDLPELVLIEQQADGMTSASAASLIPLVEKEAARRLTLAAGQNLMTMGMDPARTPAQVAEAMRRHADQIEAVATGRAAGDAHPLAQFRKLSRVRQAVKWTVPGVIEHGLVTIAGARGVGKTTALLPLALSAAGLHEPGYPLAPHPDRWRHVIYAVEQVEQAERILAGVVECSGMGITWEQVEERFHMVKAARLNVETVVQVAATYRKRFARIVDGVEILPLVIFDTQNASFDMDNENDNAEAGRIMAALKQRFEDLPVWIVGHVAKEAIGRKDIPSLSARGAGAFEGDAIQNCYLIQENGMRYLCIGKHRAEPRFGTDLMIEAGEQTTTGYNEWGEPENVHLRWGIVRPLEQSRAELREEAQEAAEKERRGDMREAVLDAVQVAWQAGNPLSKNGIKGTVRGFRSPDVMQEVEALLAEGWLYPVEVPKHERQTPSKAAFLVRLDAPEHDEFRESGTIPTAKLVIPASWKKRAIPLGPNSGHENSENKAGLSS